MRFDTGPTHNVTNAIIYCRVSSKAQTKRGDGLNSQETRCREYAKYKGYTVSQVFTDDLTGKSANRPGLKTLLAFLQADRKNPHVVIIDDLSRFARRVPLHFELRETIALAGGILESPSVELRDDADGELHEYILASVSQHQSRKNAEQTLNRMQARCFNGYWVFQPPMGFKYEKVEGHGKLLVRNEPIASIVQEALEGFASGRFDAQVEVKRFLESKPDFPKDLPNGEIRNQRITDILSRVTYAGYIEVPNWDIPLRKGHHEGLISLETYQKIQDRLKGGVKSPMRKDINEDFPLRGFIVCGDCEKPLTACWSKSKTGKKHPYYLCHNRACESHRKSIRRDKVEKEFETLLHALRPTEGLFNLTKALFKTVWDWNLKQAGALKKKMKTQIIQIDHQIEGLVDRIVDSTSPTAINAYEKRLAKLEREKHLAAEKLETGTAPKHPFDKMFELSFRFLANPWILWSSDKLEHKKTVLKLTFSQRLPYCRKNGFRTPKISLPFKLLEEMKMHNLEMAHRGGF
ncbi:MAG: recombinase family protein, partial [Methyloligellaceae bacterium]